MLNVRVSYNTYEVWTAFLNCEWISLIRLISCSAMFNLPSALTWKFPKLFSENETFTTCHWILCLPLSKTYESYSGIRAHLCTNRKPHTNKMFGCNCVISARILFVRVLINTHWMNTQWIFNSCSLGTCKKMNGKLADFTWAILQERSVSHEQKNGKLLTNECFSTNHQGNC